MNNNILSCKVSFYNQNEFNLIKLINNEYNEYVEWQNLYNEQVIYSKFEINYIYSYGEFLENKWKLKIKYDLINPSLFSNPNKALLDILVNNEESTAICEFYYLYTYLICEPTYTIQNENDIIEIVGNTTPNFGTIYWNKKLNSNQKKFNNLKLNMEYSYINYNIIDNKIYFYIRGYTSKENIYEVIENSKINIEVLINSNGKIEKIKSICLTNDIDAFKESFVSLSCFMDYSYDLNAAYISIDSNGFSNDIEFENKKENILIYISDNNSDNSESNTNSDNNV